MPEQTVHRAIAKIIRKQPDYPRLKVLDLSCGDAKLLSELTQDGCACVGTRYKAGDYILRGTPVDPRVTIVDEVDLTEALPFEDRSFDMVVMQEVVEHLPSHQKTLREVGRVLRPRGTFLITTPNIHRLHSRLLFLFAGVHKLKCQRLGWDQKLEDTYAFHHNPVDFPILHTLLYQTGLDIRSLEFGALKPKYFPLMLLYPLIWLSVVLEFRPGGSRSSSSAACEADLRRWMASAPLLVSEQLIIVATKRH